MREEAREGEGEEVKERGEFGREGLEGKGLTEIKVTETGTEGVTNRGNEGDRT